mgnify:CR=1 FL=1
MATAEIKTSEIELRERGQLTLPKSLREALRLEPGEMLRAAKVGNAIVLTPQRMDLDALRQQMRRLMKEHGVLRYGRQPVAGRDAGCEDPAAASADTTGNARDVEPVTVGITAHLSAEREVARGFIA